MDPLEFLREVWSVQGVREGVGFVCARSAPTSWFEKAFRSDQTGSVDLERLSGDIYFTPNLFRSHTRRKEGMLDSRWLYADLDEVDPRELEGRLRPTVAWETSVGRFQAMWLLPASLPPEVHQGVNKQLTYALGADRSGWDATQVLRLPGTVNYKYYGERGGVKVKLLWWDARMVRVHGSGMVVGGSTAGPQLRVVDMNGRGSGVPRWVKSKLRAKQAVGDRSKVLFKLECALLGEGFSKEEVFTLVRPSVWNKFDSDRLLSDEIHRVAERMTR